MSLTVKEREVVAALGQYRVATSSRLCQGVQVSYWTVLRALQKHGYYTSFNCNSAYFTLAEIPTFDADGLWFWEQVGFSRHRTLEATLVALVEGSAVGYTAKELEARLQTQVGNLLSRACQRGQLGGCRAGREMVYLSSVPERAGQQRSRREGRHRDARGLWGVSMLPEGADV